MADSGPSGPQRDLWGLPSEELPPGAAIFLDMVRDLQAAQHDPAASRIVTDGQGLPEPGPGDDATGRESSSPDLLPDLRLVGPPADGEDSGQPTESEEESEEEEDAGARIFLEMVDRADAVRPLPSQDDVPEPAIADWLWSAEGEGTPAAEVLHHTIEQAIWHVNHSEDIRNEELRGRLLDLFTDFAVRRPWKDEERPGAQRLQRLAEQAREEGLGEPFR